MIKPLNLLLAIERDLIVGGQAVMEGVMMRTPSAFAVAVRRADGSIARMSEKLPRLTDKYPFLKTPVLRGAATLISSMAIGIRALNYSANIAQEDDNAETATAKSLAFETLPVFADGNENYEKFGKANAKMSLPEENRTKQKPKQSASVVGSIIFALGFNILLFIVLPLLLTNVLFVALGWAIAPTLTPDANFLQTVYAYLYSVKPHSWLLFNLIDGLIRMAFFLTMIFSLSRQKEIRRVFEYHGAEHKAVFAWEKGDALTVANARKQTRIHPRCGTSFLMVVMLVAIVLFSVVNFDSILLNLLARILLLPVVAGISYEIIRYSARKESGLFFKTITAPGRWLQLVTTQEPDDTQLEVALEALQESLKLEP